MKTITQDFWAKTAADAKKTFKEGLGAKGYIFLKIRKGRLVEDAAFSSYYHFAITMNIPE